MTMKTLKIMLWMATLTLVWGCSSSDDDSNSQSTFTTSAKPLWAIDWTWNDPAPNWQEPPATQYECSMNILVELGIEFLPYSTDDDQMAIFIDGTCRSVSKPNVYPGASVVFLLHIKGTSQEAGHEMELHYYSAGAKQLFVDGDMPPFTPNNLMDESFQLIFTPEGKSSKFPLFTVLTVNLPETTPFDITSDDLMAIFVDDECRGLCWRDEYDLYSGWRGCIQRRQSEETATVRYYSADKGGIYTFTPPFKLNDNLQEINVKF